MGCEAGQCNKTSTPEGIFILISSLEGCSTKAKGAPSPQEVILTLLGTNPVFQCLGDKVYANLILQFAVVFPAQSSCKKIHTDSICLSKIFTQ